MQNLAEISHPLFEFGKPIDFTNAVIVAGLFFLLSVAVALYTGLVASRMIMFFQTRYKAALWNFEMHEPLSNATNPHDLSMQLGKVAQPIIFELRALGHHDAGLAVGKIFKSYVDHAAHLLGVPHSLEKMPALPSDVTREVWFEFIDEMRTMYASRLSVDAATVSNLRPNYWPLFTPRPFKNYLQVNGRMIGMLVPIPGRWDRLVAYFRGRF